jgi:Peptidase inhibitor family I36/Protein of unknown function (DUF3011)
MVRILESVSLIAGLDVLKFAGRTWALQETEKQMKLFTQALAVSVLTLVTTTFASGQFNTAPPRNGACFFTDYNYRGQSFCVDAGQSAGSVPSGFNDRIRSIRVYGGAQVQYFNDSNFSGASGSTSRDVSDLSRAPLPDDRNKNWGGRISSIRISGSGFDGGSYGRDNHRNNGRGHGNDRGGWKHDSDYDRNNNGSDHRNDHDYDRDRNNNNDGYQGNQTRVSCSSSVTQSREWCSTPVRVSNVRLVNENGQNRCELNRTFGVDNGRLWTARGCSGNFELR